MDICILTQATHQTGTKRRPAVPQWKSEEWHPWLDVPFQCTDACAYSLHNKNRPLHSRISVRDRK